MSDQDQKEKVDADVLEVVRSGKLWHFLPATCSTANLICEL
jgi:hypothetical protein